MEEIISSVDHIILSLFNCPYKISISRKALLCFEMDVNRYKVTMKGDEWNSILNRMYTPDDVRLYCSGEIERLALMIDLTVKDGMYLVADKLSISKTDEGHTAEDFLKIGDIRYVDINRQVFYSPFKWKDEINLLQTNNIVSNDLCKRALSITINK